MKQSVATMASFIILVILIIGLYFFAGWFSATTGYVLGENEKIKLAQCLTGKEAILYVSSTCPSCNEQLEKFGDSAASFIKTFECITAESCPAEKGVPAWEINGVFYYGVQELIVLSGISDCQIDLEE